MASQLLINEHPLQVLPTLATAIGLNEAIVLQQIHYWLNPRFNTNFFEGRHWVHNTYAKWKRQFPFWSEKTVKRAVMSLEESGFLVSFITRDFKKTKYYTIDYDSLNRIKFSDPNGGVFSKSSQEDGLENDCLKVSNRLQNQDFQLSGQNGLSIGPSCPDGEGEPDGLYSQNPLPECQKNEKKQGIPVSGQIVQVDQDIMTRSISPTYAVPSVQLVPTDQPNLSRSHTEITSETTTEITPPLLPTLEDSAREGRQEEEEETKNLGIKNTNPGFPDANSLISIWNQTVQSKIHPGQAVYLTEHREKLITQFLETVLKDRKSFCSSSAAEVCETEDPQTKAWRNYCALIAKSRFLAGNNSSGFKVTLDWALVPHNAYKILEGAIYDKPEPVLQNQLFDQSWEAFTEEIAKTLPSRPYRQEWLQISEHLAKALGQVRYKSWFSKVYLGKVTETTATFYLESNFTKGYIDNNFGRDILRAVQTLYPTVKYIDFQLVSSTGGVQ
jgi:hypothetical protein